jgi:hypothetical protein
LHISIILTNINYLIFIATVYLLEQQQQQQQQQLLSPVLENFPDGTTGQVGDPNGQVIKAYFIPFFDT